MNAQNRLKLIGVKVERAKEHFHTLEIEVEQYLNSKPYSIGVKRRPDSSQLIYFVERVHPTPIKITAILGDVIHNLRSALDHLAYQLVWVGTGSQPSSRHVYFPILSDKAEYLKKRNGKMKGAKQAAIAAVDALAPYKGGNDILWKLHELNNVDKHRMLITAGSAFQSVNIGSHLAKDISKHLTASKMGSKFSEFPALDFFVRPKDRMFPLKARDELLSIDDPDAEPNEKLQFRFEVAFGEEGIVFGDPILETISSMIKVVEDILPTFEQNLA